MLFTITSQLRPISHCSQVHNGPYQTSVTVVTPTSVKHQPTVVRKQTAVGSSHKSLRRTDGVDQHLPSWSTRTALKQLPVKLTILTKYSLSDEQISSSSAGFTHAAPLLRQNNTGGPPPCTHAQTRLPSRCSDFALALISISAAETTTIAANAPV